MSDPLTSKDVAFEKWAATLREPVQQNIRDGLQHGESITHQAFSAGWDARPTPETPARQPDGYFYRYHSGWRPGETFLSTETYHSSGLIETIPYYLGSPVKATAQPECPCPPCERLRASAKTFSAQLAEKSVEHFEAQKTEAHDATCASLIQTRPRLFCNCRTSPRPAGLTEAEKAGLDERMDLSQRPAEF